MGRNICSALLVLVALLYGSAAVYAQQVVVPPGYAPPVRDYRNYFVLKGGVFYPQGDLKDLDTGFNGEVAYGIQFSRYAAMELGSGYFAFGDTVRASTGSNLSLDGDIYVIPFTVALKLIVPLGRVDLYGMAGGGGYYIHAEGTLTSRSGGRTSGSVDTGVAGGFLGTGITYNFTRTLFVGLEGKYLWTSDADFDVHVNGRDERVHTNFGIEGAQATLNFGWRF